MNGEQLLAMYERVADAPEAVERLRQLVVKLGTSGCLLECDTRKWHVFSLGELGSWGSGGTPQKGRPEYYGGPIPWVVIGDLNDSHVTSTATSISQLGLDNSSAKLIEPGAVLIAMYGSIGKLGITGLRCATNQAIAHCIPDSRYVTVAYLFLLLKSLRESLVAEGQGVAQQNISQRILKAIKVRLPPVAEQHRIVGKVDELMALLDQLEAARKEREAARDRLTVASLARLSAPDPETFEADARFALKVLPAMTTRVDQVKELRQTIRGLAVRGQLSALVTSSAHYSYLGSDELPRREHREGRGQGVANPTRLQYNHGLPADWRLVRLSDISKRIQYGYTASASNELRDVRMLRITDIQPSGVNWDDVPGCQIEAKRVAAYRLEPGDLLIARTGGTIGKSFLITETPVASVFASYLIRVQPSDAVSPRYLRLFFDSPQYWQQLAGGSRGTGQPNVNGQALGSLQVPLPPLAYQEQIVAGVDWLMSLCDRLEASIGANATAQARLLESMLLWTLELPTLVDLQAVTKV